MDTSSKSLSGVDTRNSGSQPFNLCTRQKFVVRR
uniref:Uncharacterized protein n=1 Tax=Rhizophora mucronata TaxID=61149 RepID=A0A2P2K1A5_RHIMU